MAALLNICAKNKKKHERLAYKEKINAKFKCKRTNMEVTKLEKLIYESMIKMIANYMALKINAY